MKKVLVFIFLAVTATFSSAKAQQPGVVISDKTGWHKIGETKVDFSKDRDEVMVIGANKFSSIKFKVTEAPIDFMSVTIHFDKGDVQEVPFVMQVKSPGESRNIDLNGAGERNVKKIVFVYKTIPNYKDKKAHVEIWGMKTNADKVSSK